MPFVSGAVMLLSRSRTGQSTRAFRQGIKASVAERPPRLQGLGGQRVTQSAIRDLDKHRWPYHTQMDLLRALCRLRREPPAFGPARVTQSWPRSHPAKLAPPPRESGAGAPVSDRHVLCGGRHSVPGQLKEGCRGERIQVRSSSSAADWSPGGLSP